MNNNIKISRLEFSILLIFPILTTFNYISFNNILKISKQNAYLSIIYAYLIGFLLLYIFIYIFSYKPNLTLPDKNIYLFGKKIGTAINYIILSIISILGIIILYSTCNFIMIHYLKETPRIIILLVMVIIILDGVENGIRTIARTSFIFFIIIIILTFCSTLGLITKFEFNNLFPFFGLKKIVGAGNNLILNSFLPFFILLIVPKDYIKSKKNISKYLIFTYTLSIILIFLITILSIGILNIHLINIYTHPEYIILKKISIFNFIDKIENIVYLKWILNSFITLILIVYFISNMIKVKDIAPKHIIVITSIIGILLSFIFKTNTSITNFILNNYHYLNIILLLIFVIIFLNIFIRKNIKKET